ncbi:hypothetical protein [uncultured Alistipes sp.]|uniref:hypothetical protein n=1 Tax=uncultured Alistipes sp. TaxID=538949 RepID=UPI0025B718DA|nr:hypothetical protein [uncultured Alistipes sp.]
MKHKLAFLLAVFAATVLLLAVQKPVFLAWYAVGRGFTAADWWQVVRHGLALDMTVAGYVTALPVLAVLLSLWVRLPERPMRWLLTGYFIAVSVVVAAIFAVDLALYEIGDSGSTARFLSTLPTPVKRWPASISGSACGRPCCLRSMRRRWGGSTRG